MKSKSLLVSNKDVSVNLLSHNDITVINHSQSKDLQEEVIICDYSNSRYRTNISHRDNDLFISIFGKSNSDIDTFSTLLIGNSNSDSTNDSDHGIDS